MQTSLIVLASLAFSCCSKIIPLEDRKVGVNGKAENKTNFTNKYQAIQNGTVKTIYPISKSERIPELLESREVQVQGDLESFIVLLRSFIDDLSFDFMSFDWSVVKLNSTISEINEEIDRISPSKKLLDMLSFAKQMFHIMEESTDILKLCKKTSIRDSSLLCKIIEIRVRMLSLYNSRGLPDIKFKDYSRRVSNFARTLQKLGTNAQIVNKAPVIIKMMLYSQYFWAKESLKVLENAKNI